jgi:uncharacterized protein
LNRSPDASGPAVLTDDEIIAHCRYWMVQAVIGLNLCPFARAPLARDLVRFCVSRATTESTLLQDLHDELAALQAADPMTRETTLLIAPDVLGDFFDYNQFLHSADDVLRTLGLEGELQIASFHPDYCFADTPTDAIDNYTNRSPYPILHLLREASIERAVDSIADPDAIYRRNIATLRQLGLAGWQALLRYDPPR